MSEGEEGCNDSSQESHPRNRNSSKDRRVIARDDLVGVDQSGVAVGMAARVAASNGQCRVTVEPVAMDNIPVIDDSGRYCGSRCVRRLSNMASICETGPGKQFKRWLSNSASMDNSAVL